MNKFNIGDRVKIKNYENLPEYMKSPIIGAKVAGREATIVDRIYSEAKGTHSYLLRIDGCIASSSVRFTEDALEEVGKVTYSIEFEYLENLVVGRFFEVRDEKKTEIGKGHGHIFHDDSYGVIQAASYALKKIANNIGGGQLRRRDEE
jgi:hypothetical protein